ncbi:hypothetical protein BASA81_000860 [Batrachochytrium salamandrivorans]|nr:hypothetical protein BASA81_000860 [Batrachochytrium salamandrivorans]
MEVNSNAVVLGLGLVVALGLQRYFIHERRAISETSPRVRKILITGAASGIGRETALLFHAKGWEVGLADLNEQAAQKFAQELGLDRAKPFALDVTNPESCRSVVDAFCGAGKDGGLDALFNSAGLLAIGMFDNLDLARQTNQIRVNLEGLVNMTYMALPRLKMCKQSVIVNMASASAMSGVPTHAVYAATKAGVYSFTEALGIELYESQVRVCDVSVGYVASPMLLNQESRKSAMLALPYMAPPIVAQTVYQAALKARLHREHFYVEYSTALMFKIQGFCRTLGIRLHMLLVALLCMPRS